MKLLTKKFVFGAIGLLLVLIILKITLFFIAKPKITINYLSQYNILTQPENYDANKNAADYYQKAYDAFVETPYELSISHQDWPGDFNSTEQKLITEWLSSNSQAFEYFKKASEMPYYWMERYSKEGNSMLGIVFPELASMHRLNDAILWDAKFKAFDGQFQEAVENILASYRAGQHKCQPNFFIVEQLAGLKFKKDAVRNVFIILDKSIPDNVTLKFFEEVLQAELDKNSYLPGIEAESIVHYDILQRIFVDHGGDSGRLYFKTAFDIIPMCSGFSHYKVFFNCFTGPQKKDVEDQIKKIAVISQEIMPKTPWQVKNDTRDYTEEIQSINNSNFFLKLFGINIESIYHLHYKQKAQAKALITTLAILRFQADTGHYPESLEELVSSGYLRELPDDPYSDKPLIYNLKEDGFTLYSVGKDFIDNGGLAGETYIEKSYIGEYHEFARQKPSPDIIYWPVQQN